MCPSLSNVKKFIYAALWHSLFRARWSNQIHEEWIASVLKRHTNLKRESLILIRDLMNSSILDALIENYQTLIPSIALPDPKDAHVLAAAIHAKVSTIITFNLKDFPESELEKFDIEAQHPDEFVSHLLDLSEPLVLATLKSLRESLQKPPYSAVELIQKLEICNLPKSCQLIRKNILNI